MLIRWTFFFEEGNVKTDVKEEKEDARIFDFVNDSSSSVLLLPGDGTDLYVNLNHVKCIARQIVDEEAEKKALEEAQNAINKAEFSDGQPEKVA